MVKDGQLFLGKTALYGVNGLRFTVTVVDVKQAYGDTRFLVEPVAGQGRIWVSQNSVLFPSNGSSLSASSLLEASK